MSNKQWQSSVRHSNSTVNRGSGARGVFWRSHCRLTSDTGQHILQRNFGREVPQICEVNLDCMLVLCWYSFLCQSNTRVVLQQIQTRWQSASYCVLLLLVTLFVVYTGVHWSILLQPWSFLGSNITCSLYFGALEHTSILSFSLGSKRTRGLYWCPER